MKRRAINIIVVLLVLFISSLWAVSIFYRDLLFATKDGLTQQKVDEMVKENHIKQQKEDEILEANKTLNKLPGLIEDDYVEEENNSVFNDGVDLNRIFTKEEFNEFKSEVVRVWNFYKNKKSVINGEGYFKKLGFRGVNLNIRIPYSITQECNSSNHFSTILNLQSVWSSELGMQIPEMTNWTYGRNNKVEYWQFWSVGSMSYRDFKRIYKLMPNEMLIDISGQIGEDFELLDFYFDEYKNCYEFDIKPKMSIANNAKDLFVGMFRNEWTTISDVSIKKPTVHFSVGRDLKVKKIITALDLTNISAEYGIVQIGSKSGHVILNQTIKYYDSYRTIVKPKN